MSTKSKQQSKEKLLAMRDRLTREIRSLDASVSEHGRNAGDLSHVPSHPADRDSEGVEVNVAVEHTEWKMLDQVDAALQRIEEGTYGRCIDCDKEIPAKRLEAIPYALRCVACEEKRERAS